jgi:hypothetical protein
MINIKASSGLTGGHKGSSVIKVGSDGVEKKKKLDATSNNTSESSGSGNAGSVASSMSQEQVMINIKASSGLTEGYKSITLLRVRGGGGRGRGRFPHPSRGRGRFYEGPRGRGRGRFSGRNFNRGSRGYRSDFHDRTIPRSNAQPSSIGKFIFIQIEIKYQDILVSNIHLD